MAFPPIVAPPAMLPYTFIKTEGEENFTEAILTNAMEEENIANFPNKAEIHMVTILSVQNLDYQLWFWRTNGFADADLDTDSLLDWVALDLATDGLQIGGAGKYYLPVRLDPPLRYDDDDASNQLHISLVNRSGAAKIAGALGEVVLKFIFSPSP